MQPEQLPDDDAPAFPKYEETRRTEDALILARHPKLSRSSEPGRKLVLALAEALTDISRTSDGRSARLTKRVMTGSRGSSSPTSDLASELDNLHIRFWRCRNDATRLLVVREAQTLAKRLKYAPRLALEPGSDGWTQAIANASGSCKKLAVTFGTSRETVRRIKKAAGTLAPHGGPRHKLDPVDQDM